MLNGARERGWRGIVLALAPDPLIAILDEVGVDPDAKSQVVNEAGEPFAADGLRSMMPMLGAGGRGQGSIASKGKSI